MTNKKTAAEILFEYDFAEAGQVSDDELSDHLEFETTSSDEESTSQDENGKIVSCFLFKYVQICNGKCKM